VTGCAGFSKLSLSELKKGKWGTVTAAEAQAMVDAGEDANATYGGGRY